MDNAVTIVNPDVNRKPKMIGLSNYLGLHFQDKNQIVLFQSIGDNLCEKSCWEVLLPDLTRIKLHNHITAEKILSRLSIDHFFQINQSTIINLAFLDTIILKTRECVLIHPFETMNLTISRLQLLKLKEIFEII